MSDEMERGSLDKAGLTSDYTRDPVSTRYSVPVVSSRFLLTNLPPQPLVKPIAIAHQPARPWDFLKRLSRSDHSGWLITTLTFILVVTMTLAFGFAKGWIDAKITLGASLIFFLVLTGTMIIAHWPWPSRRR